MEYTMTKVMFNSKENKFKNNVFVIWSELKSTSLERPSCRQFAIEPHSYRPCSILYLALINLLFHS